MQRDNQRPLLFSGQSHPALAQEVADALGVKLGEIAFEEFPDGELAVEVRETVRGREVFVLQSIARDPNRYLMELLLIVDALKRSSAKEIVAVLAYYGYSRQDRKDKPRVPITARLVADLLQAAGVTHVLAMDLHADQLQGFFDIPVDSLYARPLLIEALKQRVGGKVGEHLVVAAPDVGSVKLARAYANQLGADLVVADKIRLAAQEVKVTTVIGTVEGKDVLLADDMCSTAGTLVSAAKACREKGARRIFAAVTHGLFVGAALERIEASPIEALFVSNTIRSTDQVAACRKIIPVSVASLFARAIQGIVSAESIAFLCQ